MKTRPAITICLAVLISLSAYALPPPPVASKKNQPYTVAKGNGELQKTCGDRIAQEAITYIGKSTHRIYEPDPLNACAELVKKIVKKITGIQLTYNVMKNWHIGIRRVGKELAEPITKLENLEPGDILFFK
jgi:hypothetical protein